MGDLNVSTKGAVTTCDGSVGVGGCKGGGGGGGAGGGCKGCLHQKGSHNL